MRTASQRLKNAGIINATDEARQIFALARSQGNPDEAFEALIARRAAREPFSHLSGGRDFYKHRFVVTCDVLDPRPDTETLVSLALDVPFKRVLDLGTGSGCILLSLLAERPDATGVGTDISPKTLDVAAQNATSLGVADRVTFAVSDWFSAVTEKFDLIVSNPPYIAADEMAELEPDVRDFEPRIALTDEHDGLSCYRQIVAGACDYLVPGGVLMVEIGPTQASDVSAMMQAGGFADIAVMQDLDGRDRVVSARL